MTGKQEDKLTMWTTVDTVLSSYQKIWTQLKGFEKAANSFRKIRLEIDPHAGLQSTSLKGVAESKANAYQKLKAFAAQTADNIVAYALEIEDIVLEKQFSYTPSYFDKTRDNMFPVIVNTIIEKATELLPQLEPYGVTQNSISDLIDTLVLYNDSNATPRIAVGERKTATISIVAKLNEGMHQLKIMDKLLGNFNISSPAFVSAFESARMIINLGTRTKTPALKPPALG